MTAVGEVEKSTEPSPKAKSSLLGWCRSWLWKRALRLIISMAHVFVVACLVFALVLACFVYIPWTGISKADRQDLANVDAFSKDWWSKRSFKAWSTAKELALLSWMAYSKPSDVEDFCKRDDCPYSLLGTIRPTYSEQVCFLFGRKSQDKKTLIIVFRGSDDPTDWWDNINCYSIKEGDSDGKMGYEKKKIGLHSGFANRYGHFEHAIRNELERIYEWPTLQSVAPQQVQLPEQIWITGHSLGGALALISAHQLQKDELMPGELKGRLQGVFTFAQPMVGKNKFLGECKSELDRKYVHFVNDNDIVPRLAPSYQHFGLMVHLKGDQVFMSSEHMERPKEPFSLEDSSSVLEPEKNNLFHKASFTIAQQSPAEGAAAPKGDNLSLQKLAGEFIHEFRESFFTADHSIILYNTKIETVIEFIRTSNSDSETTVNH